MSAGKRTHAIGVREVASSFATCYVTFHEMANGPRYKRNYRMFFVPIAYLSGVLILWLFTAIADRRTARKIMGGRWSTSLWLIAAAALALSAIYASPFGPARDLNSAVRWFIFGYPAWLLLSSIWLLPGVAASKRFLLNPLLVVPSLALAIDLAVESFTHWPPAQWSSAVIVGQMPAPSRYILGVPIESWYGYLYSLWPNAFMALVAAVSFLLARRLVRP